jgi:hypothetical protein
MARIAGAITLPAGPASWCDWGASVASAPKATPATTSAVTWIGCALGELAPPTNALTGVRPKEHAANSPPGAPQALDGAPLEAPLGGGIDKSALTIGAPRRYRDKIHLAFVASHPCLLCGRRPVDPHHVRFAQGRALGRRVSDEFTVPLCRSHHRELHRSGDEYLWWENVGIDPLKAARKLWKKTRSKRAPKAAHTGPEAPLLPGCKGQNLRNYTPGFPVTAVQVKYLPGGDCSTPTGA